MSPARLLAPGLCYAILLGSCAHRPQSATAHSGLGVGAWRLETRTDPFTRIVTCSVTDGAWEPDATATSTAFVFRFARRVDTSDAWYRLGAGPPHPWRDLTAKLIDAGAMGEAERMDNPSGGAVRIPTAALGGAGMITVRPARQARPKRFDLRGAWTLLHAATKLGCRFPTG